jgi:L-alanine-DL-glutamate epimerase-like enolase superfamily enzyme
MRAELRDGVSTVLVPQAPGLGIALDEDAVALQRAARRW